MALYLNDVLWKCLKKFIFGLNVEKLIFRNDVISGEVNLNGAGDVNLSSGVLYGLGTEELTEELSDELSDEDSVPRDEILTIVGEIPVVSEIDSAAPTNSVSVVSNTNSTGNDSGAIEEDIPSFEEWTKKVLAEEEKSGNYFIPFFTMIIICPMCFIRSVWSVTKEYWIF